MWKRQAAFAALIVLVAALAAMIVPTAGAGPQRASAALLSAGPLEAKALPAAATPGAAEHSPSASQTTPAPCANGTVVAQPQAHRDLVADCTALLEARDALRGTAELNWSAERRLTSWTGVRVERVSGLQRVTALSLFSRGLNGVIPAALGDLTGLRELDLGSNRLTGPIPPELGRLTRLTRLSLSGKHLSGPIPGELGAIGPSLESLQLRGPQPLPEGVGLTGVIPPQLGNLTGLRNLVLPGHRLTGSIPPRLGRLTNLTELYLSRNRLDGAIPTQLGALTNLNTLRLEDNRLSGVIPSQLGDLARLRRLDLKRNLGFTGCAPPALSELRVNDINQLDLPDCAADAPQTPMTPEPSYTLTVTSEGGGEVSPSGTTTHAEASLVTLTASWSDATHTFAGWGGDCIGRETTCELEMYADHTVTATFTPLPAERCAAPADGDCLRAVYRGAPEDYAQVQDIPAERLLSPDAEGRYEIERGEQYTVVSAAPLPAGYSRFYLDRRPTGSPAPLTHERLVPPVGTTYTFTVSEDEHAPTLITFELIAARPPLRPGLKPQLGDVVVTTEFRVFVPPLVLELSSSRELCTANTLTELSWIITGGQPPYRLTIGGERVDQEAKSHRVNCGPIPTGPLTGDPLPDPKKRFDATVRDSQATPSTASASTRVDLAPPLPAPSISYTSHEGFVIIGSDWNHAAGHSTTSLLIRFRETDADAWGYALHPSGRLRRPEYALPVTPGDRAAATAAMRDVIESETPDSLNWSDAVRLASAIAPQNVRATATHDTIAVSWDKQPYMSGQRWVVSLTSDSFNGVWSKSLGQVVAETGRHELDFPGVAPDTTYTISVRIAVPDGKQISRTSVSTSSPPPSWMPPPHGPQNLRATTAHDSITVSWDLPYPEARDYWLVRLFEESSGNEWNFTTIGGAKTWTVRGARSGAPLAAATRYRIVVSQITLDPGDAEITVTTDSAPPVSSRIAAAEPSAQAFRLPFAPQWPVSMDGRFAMTDDPFEWRGNRFHAGLDIGERGGGEYGSAEGSAGDVKGEPVYAVAGGMLRLFGYTEGQVVVSCHDDDLQMHERCHVTVDNAGSAWWSGERLRTHTEGRQPGDTFCDDVTTAAAGRGSSRSWAMFVLTTEFQVKLPPLMLELSSSRELCTANTLTELRWQISGGRPPYTLSIDGETVDAESESYRVNCGPIPTDPMGAVPGTAPSKAFSATVTDSRTIPVSVADEVRVALAEALPSVADVEPFAARSYVGMSWPNYTRQNFNDTEAWYLFRSRPQGESEWRYERVPRDRANPREVHSYVERHPEPSAQPIVQQLQVARTRLDIEAETPDALNWSPTLTVTSLIPASGIRLTATHDSVTVRWDPQASNEVLYVVSVGTRDREPYSGASKHVWLQPDSKHEVAFTNLLPSTEYHANITVRAGIETMETKGPMIRTAAAPDDYEPFPIGPQNLRVTNVTNTSISVRWDRPFPGASERYAVNLFRADWPSNPVLHVRGHGQYQARFNNLEPGTDYVVWVTHYGTVKETARLPVSTLPSAGASTEEQRQPRAGGAPDPVPFPGFEAVEPPRVSWPLHFDDLRMEEAVRNGLSAGDKLTRSWSGR